MYNIVGSTAHIQTTEQFGTIVWNINHINQHPANAKTNIYHYLDMKLKVKVVIDKCNW